MDFFGIFHPVTHAVLSNPDVCGSLSGGVKSTNRERELLKTVYYADYKVGLLYISRI
jgi:hypothetical protein